MQKVYAIFIVLWALAGILPAQTVPGLQAGIDRFREGQHSWSAEAMESARTEFSAATIRSPGEYLPLYWQSVSEFYLLLCYGLEDSSGFDPDRAAGILKASEQTMRAAIAARPQEAECHAMLSSVYGFRILMHPFSAVWNGPKVLSLQRTALENEADNPRALYIIGAGYFRAPKLFRNVDKARGFLEQAHRIFEQTPASDQPDRPQWGRAECCGLLGDLRREQGELDAAMKFYQEALRVNPAYTPAQKAMKEISSGKAD
jgi:tetratricopeptide (TPR) repeat protein